ncbi:hypothetical protein BDV30DRAFT_210412 [Aspergillus minisclerotigenes]|uniref:Uncharacterized protein n=1 Tax=Aspergillus minisclerotigenes TaxID=656917 RepID=A0A5N6J410_9EURO|nr:hypothetical protein BDV30DRAFT_210412 [Aspergillus minisclerotigenes]
MRVDTCPKADNTLVPKSERSGSADWRRPLEHHCVGLALLMTTSPGVLIANRMASGQILRAKQASKQCIPSIDFWAGRSDRHDRYNRYLLCLVQCLVLDIYLSIQGTIYRYTSK